MDPTYVIGASRQPKYWERVWTWDDTAAGRWAAPWWLLTWLLTFGRHGKPLWQWEEKECDHGVLIREPCEECRALQRPWFKPGAEFTRYVSNLATFDRVLVTPSKLDKVDIEALRREWMKRYADPEQHGSVHILEHPVSFCHNKDGLPSGNFETR
jgi:hypothetical protein